MKTYLVTGGAGFIGSNFILYLFNKYKDKIRVINMDSLTYAGNLENLKTVESLDNYIFLKEDIRDKEAVNKIFKTYDIDRVIHLAAESHVDRSILDPEIFVSTNVMGTLNLIHAAKMAWETDDGYLPDKMYVQVSTDEVYGELKDGKGYFYETTGLDPRSPYSASKTSADLLVKSYVETYQFPANITRCSNNYGPFQFPEKLIPLMINNALAGKKMPVYGSGKNVRDWLYVDDHCKAIDLVAEDTRFGEVYNVGGHNEKENIQIVNIIIDSLLDMLDEDDPRRSKISKELISYVEDRKGHDFRYAIAPDKIKANLGWEPETPFSQGIKLTIKWYLDNMDWMDRITKGEYQKYYQDMYSE